MFERLMDVISAAWDYIIPFVIVDQTEGGLVKRLGKFNREVESGLVWKWPFFEDVETVTTVITTMGLNTQTLTTKDNKTIIVAAIVKFQVKDIKPYLLEIWDSEDVLEDITMGEIKRKVTETDYADIFDIEPDILKAVRRQMNQYGFKIYCVTFTDIGAVRSLRLIQE